MMLLKCVCQQIWKTWKWPQDWKISVFIPVLRREMPKNVQIIVVFHSFHMLMLKILEAWLQQYVNQELPDVQVEFQRGRGTRDQTANIRWLLEKAKEFQKKTSTSASLTVLKPLTVCIPTKGGKFLKRQEYQATFPVS